MAYWTKIAKLSFVIIINYPSFLSAAAAAELGVTCCILKCNFVTHYCNLMTFSDNAVM